MVNALAAGTPNRIVASKERYAMIVAEQKGREEETERVIGKGAVVRDWV